jgi:uncharacterized SAM-binding protein YcdF (DUF218 family)
VHKSSTLGRWLVSRRGAVLSLVLVGALAGYAFIGLGRFMAPEDPLTKADAIFVFAGRYLERPYEAADLYLAGYAPVIVLTRDMADEAVARVRSRGVRIPSEHDVTKDALQQLGVPPAALVTPDVLHDNTREEARTLRDLALKHNWRRVIVVSSKYHLRRIKLIARRELRGTDVEVLTRGTRYDRSDPDYWWAHRSDWRWLVGEVPKYIAYAMGLG